MLRNGAATTEPKAKRRPFRVLAISLWVVLVIEIGYGAYRFQGAPIALVDGQYVDKFGRPHSKDEFDRLKVWERIYIASFIAMMAAMLAAHLEDPSGRRKW